MKKRWIATAAMGMFAWVAAVSAEAPPPLLVTGAWVRALPPGQANTAAYMKITNPAGVNVVVAGASSAVAQKAEFHRTREVDGYQRMEQLSQLELAPGETLELAPGGTHMMLLGLDRMPVPGDSVTLCLQPAGAGKVCTQAEVRGAVAPEQAGDHHHAH